MSSPAAPQTPAVNRRWWLWLPLLGVGAGLAIFGDKAPQQAEPVVGNVPTRVPDAPRPLSAASAGDAPLMVIVPRQDLIAAPPEAHTPRRGRDLFSVRDWTPPPPPPSPPAPPPPPVAPPVPFRFVGKKLDAQQWEVYLTRGEFTFLVREGQVLEGMYRVEKIAPPTLTLTYLPLGQAQTLGIGEAQ